MRLFNSQGVELAFNNDANAPGENVVGFDSYLRHTFIAAGTYYIGVSNANNTLYSPTLGTGDNSGGLNATGDYTLTVVALPVDTDDQLSEAVRWGRSPPRLPAARLASIPISMSICTALR